MGILHAAVAPVLVVNDVKPNVVLVAVVLVASLIGFAQAIPWAFIAGTSANVLGFAPLGSVPLALLTAATLVAAGGRLFGRLTWIFPVVAAAAASLVYDLVMLGILNVLGTGIEVPRPLDVMLLGAGINALLTAVLLPPARLLARRIVDEERPAW